MAMYEQMNMSQMMGLVMASLRKAWGNSWPSQICVVDAGSENRLHLLHLQRGAGAAAFIYFDDTVSSTTQRTASYFDYIIENRKMIEIPSLWNTIPLEESHEAERSFSLQ